MTFSRCGFHTYPASSKLNAARDIPRVIMYSFHPPQSFFPLVPFFIRYDLSVFVQNRYVVENLCEMSRSGGKGEFLMKHYVIMLTLGINFFFFKVKSIPYNFQELRQVFNARLNCLWWNSRRRSRFTWWN